MKKKLLLIGNKPIEEDVSEKVDSFDFVVRVNRMTNVPNTGRKIDGYYLGMWRDFREQYHGGEHRDIMKEAKVVFCHPRVYENRVNIFEYITKEQYMTAEIINVNASRIGIGTQYPTSTISVLWYLVNSHWAYEYDIYIFGIDIEGRDELFRSNAEWNTTTHVNAGGDEAEYMKRLIAEGKIKVLEA